MGVGPHAHHGAENSVGCETPPPIPTGLQTSFVGRYPQHGAEDPLFLWGLCWGLVFGVVGAPEGPEKRGMSWHPQLVSNSLVNHPHAPNVHDPKSVSIPQVFQLQRPGRAGVRCPSLLLPGPAAERLCAQHPVWIRGAGAGGSGGWGRGTHGGLWGRVGRVAAGPGWGHRHWCCRPAAAGGCGSTHGTEGAQGYHSCEGVGVRAV